MRRFLATVAAALVLAAALVTPASGQDGPRYIIVHGGTLPAQVVMVDAAANAVLVTAPDVEPRAGVPREADRPVFELALFYNVPDMTGRTPQDLRPDETEATGRFFPAVGELEAIFELGAVPGIGPRRDGGLTPPMLDYLVANGIPVVSDAVLPPEAPTATPTPPQAFIPPENGEGRSPSDWVIPLAIAGAVIGAIVLAATALRRRPPKRRGVHF